MKKRAGAGRFMRYLAVGAAGTGLQFLLYNVLRVWLTPLAANGLAVVLSVIFAWWGNRVFTFRLGGTPIRARTVIEFFGVFLATLAASSAALQLLLWVDPAASRLAENLVLALSLAVTTIVRYWLLRSWVFSRERVASS